MASPVPLPPLGTVSVIAVSAFHSVAAAAAASLQSCPTLCDPTEGSPPASVAPGILQARTLERVAVSSVPHMYLPPCVDPLMASWT